MLIGAYVYVRRRERRMERLYEDDAERPYEAGSERYES